ncbi:MAG TPA: S8 family serine peptidase [Ardenticatenaceae bacterium]|jgi:subtilisin family serine protease
MSRKLYSVLAAIAVIALCVVAISSFASAGTARASSEPFLTEAGVALSETEANEPDRYIIQLTDAPLASYRGGIRGLAATQPRARGEVYLDPDSAASVAYLAHLDQQQTQLIAGMSQTLGRQVEVVFRYQYAFNGIAAVMSPAEAARIAALPGVKQVVREYYRYIQTDAGPEWIEAPAIWNGTSTGGLPGTQGEGIVVGVIDTGINTDHPSFADVGGDGYNHENPRGQFFGLCDPVLGLPYCNDKLIGVHSFVPAPGAGPEDDNGHGSHTASTAAGNHVTATVNAPTISIERVLSGVAPHANIIAYKACASVPALPPEVPPPPVTGTCPISQILAAINVATLDRPDVINYSIGGPSSDPYADLDAQAFLAARDAGIFVATSAGNSGPGATTIGSPADAPWLLAVGATTHNRAFLSALVDMMGGDTDPPADIQGKSFSAGYGPAPIVYAGDYGDPFCALGAFPADTFSGEIVVCDRGNGVGRVDKGRSVQAGGAGGMVLANDEPSGDSLVADPHVLPTVHITYEDGLRVKAWIATGDGQTATIAPTEAVEDVGLADIMASFSSRGPNPSVPDLLKPDISAPGVDILAAVNTGFPYILPSDQGEFGLISGTSMASPHAAGSAALLRALHPEWTPAEVQSALMTTASNDFLRKEDGVRIADALDTGSGRVDLSRAGRAGLVLDETVANFEASNPANGGDPKTLNLASMANSNCVNTCSWTRTVTSTLDVPVTWTAVYRAENGFALEVVPNTFTLAPGEEQTIEVTAYVSGASIGDWIFAEVQLEPNVDSVPVAHFPVAVVPTGVAGAFQRVNIVAEESVGSEVVTATSPVQVDTLAKSLFGLTPGLLVERQVPQDPTLLDPYDAPVGTFYVTTTVPAGAKFLLAEIVETTSQDIDLFVGTGETPSAATEVCSSATDGPMESCKIDDPEAGTYWILVQNWLTGMGLDTVVLQTVVIPGTYNNNWDVTLNSPMRGASNTTLDLTVSWAEPQMDPGEYWFGLAELRTGTEPSANIGALLVRIQHEGTPTSITLGGLDTTTSGGVMMPWLALGLLGLTALGLAAARRVRRNPTS